MAGALDKAILRSPDLVRGTDTDAPLMAMFENQDFQPTLHQAAGVLFERHGWAIDDAIALIRAHAYAEDQTVTTVAEQILDGCLWVA